jgi:1,3-beta-glucanosyltransferase GAS1
MFAKALASAVLLASYAITAINAIDPISVVGTKFFYKNGTQYYIKGTPSPQSPL